MTQQGCILANDHTNFSTIGGQRSGNSDLHLVFDLYPCVLPGAHETRPFAVVRVVRMGESDAAVASFEALAGVPEIIYFLPI